MGKATRFAILGIRLALLASAASLAHAESSPPSDITIPPDLGYVVESHPAADPSSPLIIHIQEAHTNYEAQKHLAEILDALVTQHGLKLILVEGGDGDAGMAYLRTYGPPENRQQVADKYLKLGILSGEEYLDIVSDYPLILWGVEQEDLYQRNVEAFLQAETVRGSVQPTLALFREAVDALKPVLFSPDLHDLDAKSQAFEQDQLALADYVAFLTDTMRRAGVAEEQFPALAQFAAVHALEQRLDLELVQRQQKEVVNRLRDRAQPERFAHLMEQAKAVEEGTATTDAFYTSLDELAEAVGLPLASQYPSLSTYIHYLHTSRQLQPHELAKELERIGADLRPRLASTSETRQLVTIEGQLELLERLLELSLSPDEYERFKAVPWEETIPGWAEFLSARLAQAGRPTQAFAGADSLTASLASLRQFYDVAQARDEALVSRTLEQVRQRGERLAVLITGGFHSPQVTQRLKDSGVGVALVTPKVTQPTNERLYQAVLKYKSGHGSFEDVEAAAQMAQGGVRP